MTQSTVYCIDSSALIDLKQLYPIVTFPGLWHEMSELVKEGRLIAPREVLKEVVGDRDLKPWLRQNKRMFVALSDEQLAIVTDILRDFSPLVDFAKETADADPFIIALAISKKHEPQELFDTRKYVVLTSEKLSNTPTPKIPNVCEHYHVECLAGSTALTQFFRQEGWEFWNTPRGPK
ncbi:MAG: hypothetical protein AMK72_15415 [Planctomycetes bacterium SM23_25]|nr:MAG: hypothetical protein AMK72_15415 [Planctomycetes bacterium SM23_25]